MDKKRYLREKQIMSAQDRSLQTRWVKHYIDRTMCAKCVE